MDNIDNTQPLLRTQTGPNQPESAVTTLKVISREDPPSSPNSTEAPKESPAAPQTKSRTTTEEEPSNETQGGEFGKTLDLRELYPITYRRAFKKAFWRGLACLIIGAAYLLSDEYLIPLLSTPEDQLTARAVLGTLFVLSFIWWLARVIYYQVERVFTEYRVDGGNLYLRRGLFVKETGSFPLSRITDIYLHRGWGDLFWGLSSLHVSTPTQSSGTFAYIHGLTIKNAETLQRHLQELVKQHDYQLQLITGHVGSLAASAASAAAGRRPREIKTVAERVEENTIN